MSRLANLKIISVAFFLAACSRQGVNDATLKFRLPDSSQKVSSSSKVNSLNSSQWSSSDPTTLSEINCYAVLISRSPEESKNTCLNSSDGSSFNISQAEGLYPAGAQVEVVLNSGPSQMIYLVGFKASANSLCEHALDSSLDLSEYSHPHMIAKKAVSISPGINVVNMTASLSGSQKIKSCRGPTVSFGEPAAELPTVSISSSGGNFINSSNMGSFPLSGTCSENGQPVAISSGGVQLNTVSCSSGAWNTTVDLSGFIDGSVLITADHSNAAGDSAPIPGSRNLTKDTVAPTLSIASPTSGSVVDTSNQNAFAVSGSCSENSQSIQLSGTASSSAVCVGGAWSTTLNYSTTPEGPVTLSANLSDAAGNTYTAPTVTFTKNIITPASLTFLSAPSPLDFGSITRGTTINQLITLKNEGETTAANISTQTFTGDFSFKGGSYPGSGGDCSSSLAPGGTCTLYIQFAPTDIGLRTSSLDINYDTSQTASLPLEGIGLSPANLTFEATPSPNFGAVQIGGIGLSQIFNVHNDGESNATSIVLSGLPSGSFSLTAGGNCGTTLTAGSSCTIEITYAPTAVGSSGPVTLNLDYDDGTGGPQKTATLNLTGNGVQNKITLSNLVVNNVEKNGFDFSVDLSGDQNTNGASVLLKYCDASTDPSCTPGTSLSPTQSVSANTITGSVTGLTGETFQKIKIKVSSNDPDGMTSAPLEQTFVLASTFLQVASGYSHTCGLTPEHKIKCWGTNFEGHGVLGNGTTDTTPVTSGVFVTGDQWTSVASSQTTTCAIDSNQDGYCWGKGTNGQIGDGSILSRSSPTLISGSHKWLKISPGLYHTCGLTTAGDVYCWGANADGQLGNGTVDSSVPLKITGSHEPYKDVTAGRFSSCALAETDTAYCWGNDSYGQLGDGAATTSGGNVPVAVGGVLFEFISLNHQHVCGSESSTKKLYCWGDGPNGEVGNGSQGIFTGPVSNSSNPTGWTKLDVGDDHSCGLIGNDVYCWGSNNYDQVGDGSGNTILSPVSILTGQSDISAGSLHTCSIATDGTLWCWGNNDFGQLGDGSTTVKAIPTHVSP